jgi:hypothetical protein
MANEPVNEQVVAGTEPVAQGGEKTPAGAQPDKTAQSTTPGQTPASAQANRGDDSQQRGLIADLQKERQARQRLEQQFQQLQGNLDAERRRVQALAGVTPRTQEDQDLDEIRGRIVKMFPALGKLTEEQLDRLAGLESQASSIEEATQHHWTVHSKGMLSNLYTHVATEIGGDLSERQKQAIGRAYLSTAEQNPEFLARHEAGDPKLIEEFAKAWIEDWFEPARKAVVQTEARRFRPVPGGRDRTVQTTPAKAIDFKNPKAVEDAMVESFRRHGGGFDN